jgi:putative hemolysin
VLTASTNLVLRVFGLRGEAEPHLTEDEIRAVVSQGVESGALNATEEALVQRVFRLSDQRVASILTPRVDIEWVDRKAAGDALRAFLAGHRHSQFLVCDGSLDKVVGVVRAADLLPGFAAGTPPVLADVMQEPLFVPDATPVFRLLETFRVQHRHVAVVLDEFGAVEGLVTATDLLEAFVGDMPTEPAARAIVPRADGSWLVDGTAGIGEVVEHLGLDALPDEESGAYHTLGGFILARLGRIPQEGDAFEWDGVRFEVVDMDGRRIDKVLVARRR